MQTKAILVVTLTLFFGCGGSDDPPIEDESQPPAWCGYCQQSEDRRTFDLVDCVDVRQQDDGSWACFDYGVAEPCNILECPDWTDY